MLAVSAQVWCLLALFVLLTACADVPMTPADVQHVAEDVPTREGWDVRTRVTQTQAGRMDSRLRMAFEADYAATLESEGKEYQRLQSIDRPVMVFLYDAIGDTSATLAAREVRYYDAENRLEAYGDVVVKSADGRQIVTQALIWRESDRTIRTDLHVHITSPTEDVEGYGLVADERLETYQLGRFTARVVIEE